MQTAPNIDQRFLSYLSDLLYCSRCLRHGVRTRIRQIISPRHRPSSLCDDCRRGRTLRPQVVSSTTATPPR